MSGPASDSQGPRLAGGAPDGPVGGVSARAVTEMDRARWLALRERMWPDADPAQHQREMRRLLDDTGGSAVIVLESEGRDLLGVVEISRRFGLAQIASGPFASIDGYWLEPAGEPHAGLLLERATAWASGRGCSQLVELQAASEPRARGALLDAAGTGSRTESCFVHRVAVSPGPAKAAGTADRPRIDPERPAPGPGTVLAEPSAAAAYELDSPGAGRRPAWMVHAVVGVAALASLAYTDIWSRDVLRGAVLPVADMFFIIYFAALFYTRRVRRQKRRPERTSEQDRLTAMAMAAGLGARADDGAGLKVDGGESGLGPAGPGGKDAP